MIRNLGLLLLAIVASLLIIPLAVIRNLIYKLHNFDRLNTYIFAIAHGIDVMGASALYGTTYKTISGVTGRKSYRERRAGIKNSYIYPFEKFIDWLLDDPEHCYNAFKKEYQEDI